MVVMVVVVVKVWYCLVNQINQRRDKSFTEPRHTSLKRAVSVGRGSVDDVIGIVTLALSR